MYMYKLVYLLYIYTQPRELWLIVLYQERMSAEDATHI